MINNFFDMKNFKTSLQKGLRPIYILKLSDLLYRKEIVKMIKSKFGENSEILYYSLEETPLNDVILNFKSQDLFGAKKIIVCYDADSLSEKEKKLIIKLIEKYKKVKNSILIIFFDNKKINHPLFREISIPSEEELKKFIILYFKKNGIHVDKKFAEYLIEHTGIDYNKISLELKKILSFAEGKKELTIEDIKDLIKFSREQNIFKLFDYFFEKNFNKCIQTFYILKELNINVNLLINILQKNLIQIAKIKSLLLEDNVAEKDIYKILNLNSYVAKKLIFYTKNIKFNAIKEMFNDLFEIEKISKTSNVNIEILFENFLIRHLK